MLVVPMDYGNPIELGAQILLHRPDKIAREGFEVRHFHGVVGRDNETEMVPVVFAPLCERLRIGIIGAGAKQPRLLSVPGDALAAQIVQVSPERRVASAMAAHARLDDSAARAGRAEPVRLNRGTLDAAEPRAGAGPRVGSRAGR